MPIPRRVAVLVTMLGLLASGAAEASAQGVPSIPGIPTIPGLPGQEKARFKVVVEGTSTSSATANGGGDGGTGCSVTIKDVDITERFEYGRGKGVTMEFSRFKAAGRSVITLQRSGRQGDASFAVRGKIQRTVGVEGLVTRAPIRPTICPLATEHPAASEGCNRQFGLSADMKFVYGATAGTVKLQPTSTEGLRGLQTPVADCPQSMLFGQLSGLVAHPWPVPLNLPAQRLRAKTIFGSRKGFTLRFVAAEVGDPEGFPPGFSGEVKRESDHHAVARFTRLK